MTKFLNSDGLSRLVALIKQALGGKQDTLVSGTNIKTVNSNSILGSGNINLKANNILMSDDDPNGDWVEGDTVEEALVSKSNAINALQPNEIASISTAESSASGGNNTVTITETNGTSHTFNVKNGIDGADGVSLGEVGLVQTTGNATDKVMSQNAVTEYGRKVTTEDLAGTSDWSQSVLEENGWIMGAFLTGDTTTANADLCTTHFIPINDISGHNVVFYFGHSNSGARIQFYLENKTYKDFYGTSPANKRTQLIAASLSTCRWIRMACGINVISQCYIYDNSTDEYIWKGDEYIDRLVRDKNPVLDYGFFEDNIVKQTEGNSETSVMSQKAVTKQTVRFTEGDLTGTGDWIKAKMQELGWAFDSRLNNVGEVVTQSGYAATGFIPIGDLNGHSITFGFMYNSYSDGNVCFYNGNKVFTSGHYYNTNANNSRTVTPSAAYASDSYIRMTCNPLRISECYIYDNTEGEYIWRGDEYLEELYKNNLINYETYRDLLVTQETGNSTTKVVSQNKVTELTRKVTAEDLAGTSEWIRAKLTEEGWAFGKYVDQFGNIAGGANFCVSRFVEIGDLIDHSITFSYRYGGTNQQCVVFYDDNNARVKYWFCNQNNSRTIAPTAAQISGATKIRITFNPNDLNNCYVYDNTTNEFIFKASDDIKSACLDSVLTPRSLAQELGESKAVAVSQNVVNDVQKNIDAIGRRSYGSTAAFNANAARTPMRSEKKYDTSSKPWIDVVTYNVQGGTGGRITWFGLCPTITTTPQTERDYIGFKENVWSVDFIIRRNGTTVHTTTKAIENFSSSQVLGFRLDLRRKSILIMKRTTTGTLSSSTIDLSSYDLDLGKCYLYTGAGYCCYVADTYVGWNNQINMTSFETFFSSPMVAGKFKMFNEHTYPSDDIDGGVFAPFGKMMSTWSPTKDENEHWVASFDSPSTYINLMNEEPSVSSSHYLYTNWDLIIGIGKLKVVSGTLYLKAYSYYAIKDVYDLTDNIFLTATNDEYVIQEGHTIEVRGRIGVNSKSHLFNVKGTCTLEMWDWEAHISINTNITPTNYDGSKIFGGIEFLNDKPNLVVDVPLVASSNYFFQGAMKYVSNKLYARVYDTSTNTYIDKQINNS